MESSIKQTSAGIYVLDNDAAIGKWVSESGKLCYDHGVAEVCLPHVNTGGTVIDIGAFIGDHTVAYSDKVGASGMVYAFEPCRATYACLVGNLNNRQNVRMFNFAASDKFELLDFSFIEHNAGASHAIENGSSILGVPVDFFNLSPNYIKIDCEGFEVKALNGLKETIARSSPVIICESNQGALKRAGTSQQELYNTIESFGYSFKATDRRLDLFCIQLDIIATKR